MFYYSQNLIMFSVTCRLEDFLFLSWKMSHRSLCLLYSYFCRIRLERRRAFLRRYFLLLIPNLVRFCKNHFFIISYFPKGGKFLLLSKGFLLLQIIHNIFKGISLTKKIFPSVCELLESKSLSK